MSSQIIVSAVTRAAEQAHSESINHWVVGALTLAILLGLLFALLAFGAGRDHS